MWKIQTPKKNAGNKSQAKESQRKKSKKNTKLRTIQHQREHRRHVDRNRRTSKDRGNNTGLKTNYTNKGMRCRWRDIGAKAVPTDRCETGVGGNQEQEHRREAEHWEHG